MTMCFVWCFMNEVMHFSYFVSTMIHTEINEVVPSKDESWCIFRTLIMPWKYVSACWHVYVGSVSRDGLRAVLKLKWVDHSMYR